MDFKSSFRVNATLVPNEFIDTYMASANGEYIKEYLSCSAMRAKR